MSPSVSAGRRPREGYMRQWLGGSLILRATSGCLCSWLLTSVQKTHEVWTLLRQPHCDWVSLPDFSLRSRNITTRLRRILSDTHYSLYAADGHGAGKSYTAIALRFYTTYRRAAAVTEHPPSRLMMTTAKFALSTRALRYLV